jgi:hypothetical protein
MKVIVSVVCWCRDVLLLLCCDVADVADGVSE